MSILLKFLLILYIINHSHTKFVDCTVSLASTHVTSLTTSEVGCLWETELRGYTVVFSSNYEQAQIKAQSLSMIINGTTYPGNLASISGEDENQLITKIYHANPTFSPFFIGG